MPIARALVAVPSTLVAGDPPVSNSGPSPSAHWSLPKVPFHIFLGCTIPLRATDFTKKVKPHVFMQRLWDSGLRCHGCRRPLFFFVSLSEGWAPFERHNSAMRPRRDNGKSGMQILAQCNLVAWGVLMSQVTTAVGNGGQFYGTEREGREGPPGPHTVLFLCIPSYFAR